MLDTLAPAILQSAPSPIRTFYSNASRTVVQFAFTPGVVAIWNHRDGVYVVVRDLDDGRIETLSFGDREATVECHTPDEIALLLTRGCSRYVWRTATPAIEALRGRIDLDACTHLSNVNSMVR